MDVLVIGGTAFLSYAVAQEALARGHAVTCAARGTSGPVPDGAELVVVDREDPDGLAALAGARFDSVVDVATMSYPWVTRALQALAASTAHWTFVSTISVYADAMTLGQDEDAPTLEPIAHEAPPEDRHKYEGLYGGIKVAAENAVRDTLGDRALIARSGLIVGPGDRSDRFGYWCKRLAAGGPTVVPDIASQATQYLDVRDFAAWIVTAAEQRVGGVCNAVGPVRTFEQTLAGIDASVGASDVEYVTVPTPALDAAGVQVWAGPKSLPLWLPDDMAGFCAHSNDLAAAAGLTHRPLAEIATDTLAHERDLGVDRPRASGLSADEERSLLAGVR